MLKPLVAAMAALVTLCAAAAGAAVDANQANRAELEAVKGVGPSLAGEILDARRLGRFRDWADFVARVKGISPRNAARFSAAGLTVGGAAYEGAAASAAK